MVKYSMNKECKHTMKLKEQLFIMTVFNGKNKAWVRSRLYYRVCAKARFLFQRSTSILEYRYCLHSVFKQIKFKS